MWILKRVYYPLDSIARPYSYASCSLWYFRPYHTYFPSSQKLTQTDEDIHESHRRIGDNKPCSSTMSSRKSGSSAAAPLQIRHLRTLNWPEGSSLPTEKWTLLTLCEQVFKCHRKSPDGGIIVHCLLVRFICIGMFTWPAC